MSKFVLECEVVQNASDNVLTSASDMDGAANTVASVVVDCPDVDLETPKQAIVTNIKAAAIKMKNTSNLMNKVIEDHTALQTSMVYEPSVSTSASAGASTSVTTESTTSASSSDSSSSSVSSSSSGFSAASSAGVAKSSSASTSGTRGSSVSSGSSNYTSSAPSGRSSSASARNVSAAAMAASTGSLLATNAAMGASAEARGMTKVAEIRNGQVEILEGYEGMFTEDDILKMATKEIIEVPEGLGKVHTYMGWQMVTNTSSKQYELREAAGMNFDSEGFAKIEGKYVVACTDTFGEVGDYVDFVQEDGSVIETVIGDIKSQSYTSYDHNPANKWGHNDGQCILEFVVDKSSWYNSNHPNPGTSACHPEWNQCIVSARNYGNYFDFNKGEATVV